MIISPSISQILRGIIHEIGGDFKTGLDPVKSAQIDTIIGVLGSCAVRADHQAKFIHEEVEATVASRKNSPIPVKTGQMQFEPACQRWRAQTVMRRFMKKQARPYPLCLILGMRLAMTSQASYLPY